MTKNTHFLSRWFNYLAILYFLFLVFYLFYFLVTIDISLLGTKNIFYILIILLTYLLPPIFSYKYEFKQGIDHKTVHRDTLIATVSAAIVFLLKYGEQMSHFAELDPYGPLVLVPFFVLCSVIYYIFYFIYRILGVSTIYSIINVIYKLFRSFFP